MHSTSTGLQLPSWISSIEILTHQGTPTLEIGMGWSWEPIFTAWGVLLEPQLSHVWFYFHPMPHTKKKTSAVNAVLDLEKKQRKLASTSIIIYLARKLLRIWSKKEKRNLCSWSILQCHSQPSEHLEKKEGARKVCQVPFLYFCWADHRNAPTSILTSP